MKALIFNKAKTDWDSSKGFELVGVPKPTLQNGDDVIIKVHYAGVCGTDKGMWYRQAFKEQILGSLESESFPPLERGGKKGEVEKGQPLSAEYGALSPRQERVTKSWRTLGHEFFGEIVEVGKAVKNLKVGDFVACESHVVDDKCYQCQRGEKHVCTNEKILGISHDGGFAEYARVPERVVWKTDTSKIRPEVAAMQEPFGNAVHAASKVDMKDKTVAIFGLGPIGLFLLLIAKAKGAKIVIGVEPNPISIDMAKKLGIDYVIKLDNPSQPPLTLRGGAKDVSPLKLRGEGGVMNSYAHNPEITSEILKITKGVGVDVSFEMAGFNSSVNNCLYATRRGGEIILFGIKSGDFTIENYNRLIVHGFTIHAVIGRQIWQTWETTRGLLEDPTNQIQEKLFNVILDQGNGTILPIGDYTKERFEEMINQHPKFLIQF